MNPGFRGEPKLGKWDYDGEYAHPIPGARNETFSVGIFQWVPTVCMGQPRTDYLKRGKSVCRVHGLTSEPEMVYKKALMICGGLDTGFHPARKHFTAERRAK